VIDDILIPASRLTFSMSLLGLQQLGSLLPTAAVSGRARPLAATSGQVVGPWETGGPPREPHVQGNRSDVRRSIALAGLSPRQQLRWILTSMRQAAELAKPFTPERQTVHLQEFQNKIDAFSLFAFVDIALGFSGDADDGLAELVSRASRLGPYSSVWATEGVGHTEE
jgi:hypothetical protein